MNIEGLGIDYIRNRMTVNELSKKYDIPPSTIKKILARNSFKKREIIIYDINSKFQNLTLVERLNKKNSHSQTLALFRCDCGKIVEKPYHNVIQGHIHSCGCIRKAKNFRGYENITGSYWYRLQRNAKVKGIDFSIDIKYAWNLYLKQDKKCAISGLNIDFYSKLRNINEYTASLDRKNSNIGYIEENVQWVHKHINFMKHSLTQEDFINYCRIIIQYQDNKNVKMEN